MQMLHLRREIRWSLINWLSSEVLVDNRLLVLRVKNAAFLLFFFYLDFRLWLLLLLLLILLNNLSKIERLLLLRIGFDHCGLWLI